MEDEGEVDNEFFDISTLSEAEKRRLRRRQRILDNQGARLQRILNNDSSSTPKEADQSSSQSKPETLRRNDSFSELSKGVDLVDGASFEAKAGVEVATENLNSKDTPIQSSDKRKVENVGREPSSLTASLLQELSVEKEVQASARESAKLEETRMGVQSDGTIILPKISEVYGRVLICLLGLFLSIFNAKRCVITFISWEVAYYGINGLPPLPPPNMAMVLAAVMGLRETQLVRVKKILHFSNCVLVDFSLFLVFTLLPHIVRNMALL